MPSRARASRSGARVTAGRRARVGAVRQIEALVAALLRVGERLERRGGRAEDHRHPARVRTHHRNVARVVAHAILLLVRAVVLLVDHDEREPRQRREDREPRAEHEVGLPPRGRFPVPSPRAGRQPAVQRDGAHARQGGPHACLEMRREIDLGHEDQHLAAGRDRARGGVEVDLGLAAAGHALQQEGRVAVAGGDDGLDRRLLRGVARVLRQGRRIGRAVAGRRLAPDARARGQGRNRQGEHLSDGRLVVGRDEAAQVEDVGRQRGAVGHGVDRPHALGRERRLAVDVDDDPMQSPRTEMRFDDVSGRERKPGRHPVVEELVERDRQRDARDGHRGARCPDAPRL